MLHVWLFLANFQRSRKLLTNLLTTTVDLLKNHLARRESFILSFLGICLLALIYMGDKVLRNKLYCAIRNNILECGNPI